MHPSEPTWRPIAAWRVLARELGAFGVVGAGCFLLDVGLFHLLYAVVAVDAVLAKLLATLVAMTVAFVGHRHWSFAHRARTGVRREYTLFAAVNGVALCLGLAVVAVVRHPLGQESALVLQAANVASIALGTLLRFVSYRIWVFPRPVPGAAVHGPGVRPQGSAALGG